MGLFKRKKSKEEARAGEFWSVNNKRTAGHPAQITKRTKNNKVEYIATTHSKKTFNRSNIKLIENPDKQDVRPAYVLPRVQKGKIKDLGKNHPEMKIKNPTDKAVVRHIKKQGRKKK